jgi:hypothetical protein
VFFFEKKFSAHFDSIMEDNIAVVTMCQKKTIIMIEKKRKRKRLYAYDDVQIPDIEFFLLFSSNQMEVTYKQVN